MGEGWEGGGEKDRDCRGKKKKKEEEKEEEEEGGGVFRRSRKNGGWDWVSLVILLPGTKKKQAKTGLLYKGSDG